jgi:hypothetical protein
MKSHNKAMNSATEKLDLGRANSARTLRQRYTAGATTL